jgi:hypothetical protein
MIPLLDLFAKENVMADAENAEEGGEEAGRNKLGAEVAAQMEAIENDFGDDYTIGTVVTVVEVHTSEGAGVRVRCNAPPWVGLGMLRMAEKALEAQGQG